MLVLACYLGADLKFGSFSLQGSEGLVGFEGFRVLGL